MYPKSNVKLSSCTTTQSFMTPTRQTGKVKLEQCCIYHSASALWDLLRGHGAEKNLRQPDFNQQMLSTANPHCRGWSEPVLPRTDWASAQSPVHTYTAGHRHRLQPLHWRYPWQPANDSGSHADTSHINLVIRPTFSDESISLSLQLYLYLRFKYLLDVMAGIKVQRNIFMWILMWKWISLVELCRYTITNLHKYSITLRLRLNTCNSRKVNIHLFSYFIFFTISTCCLFVLYVHDIQVPVWFLGYFLSPEKGINAWKVSVNTILLVGSGFTHWLSDLTGGDPLDPLDTWHSNRT